MKHLLGTMAASIISLSALSQTQKVNFSGKVVDAATKQPIASATVKLGSTATVADVNGNFSFAKVAVGNYDLQVTSVGYVDAAQKVSVGKAESAITVELKASALYLQPLEVKSLRAGDRAPFTKTNIGKEDIAKTNLGQDIPFLLNQTPSTVINSDAGNGVGYTNIYIRGVDLTRINVTLNGIPYNDAESQGTYWVDIPDMASSLNSIQIQRGVGTSSNGTGAFGATINLQTNEFIDKAYAESNNSFGSFNTWKNTLKAGTGLIDGHFTVDARLSRISSDGYIDRATSNLQSFSLSAAYYTKQSSLRLNIFSGKEKTYQAWNGVPENILPTNRTYNSFTYPNQTDNYQQNHYQLFFNHQFNGSLSFNTAVFFTPGIGYYEEYKTDQAYSDYGLPNYQVGTTVLTTTDLIRQLYLDNKFYGQIASLQYKKNKHQVIVGGGWSTYEGGHYGNIIWTKNGGVDKDYQWYNNPAVKTDINAYAKWQYQFANHFELFTDLQYKHVRHIMNGFRNNPTLVIDRAFDFLNPKLGISYANKGWQVYASYAMANKEPNRDDFEAGVTTQPKAEKLNDFELGVERKGAALSYGATFYYMDYKDQLVLTGKVNDVGAYTRTNVPNSYRLGVELQAGYVFTNWLNANGNITLSKNKIKSFTEYLDAYDANFNYVGQNAVAHTNTTIGFSPSIISAFMINVLPVKNVTMTLLGKYVGKQYLDNAESENRILGSFFTQDARVSYTLKNKLFKEWNFIAQVSNIFNRLYEPNGYTYTYYVGNTINSDNAYYPMAGTNFMLGVNIKF
jgi:iron complex outermembrane receptor protein